MRQLNENKQFKITIMIFLLFTTAIIAITILVIALLNHRIKLRMIKAGFVDDNAVKALNKLNYDLRVDTLKWGLVFLSGGAGLIVLSFMHFMPDSPMPYGIELLFIAVGLLSYFLLTRSRISNS